MERRSVRDIGSVKKRKYGKFALEKAMERNYESLLAILAAFHHLETNEMMRRLLMDSMFIFGFALEDIRKESYYISEPIERKFLRFISPSLQENFTIYFRFKMEEMPLLMNSLNIPAEFKLSNGSWVNGQEGLLVLLKFLASPTRQVDEEDFFGWENTRLSKILKWMKSFIYHNHGFRVQNCLEWHAKHFEASKQAIQTKKRALHQYHQLHERTENVCLHFDGFRIKTCRPQDQSRVTNDDDNDMRIDLDIQSTLYNGKVKVSFLNTTSLY
jgi:hypothetical protein